MSQLNVLLTTPVTVVVVVIPVIPIWVVIMRITRIIAVVRPVVAIIWPVVPWNTEPKTKMYSGLGLSRRPGHHTERDKR